MSANPKLDEKACELLRSGRLPRQRPHRLWGGRGSGRERCLVCGDPILAAQTALEVDFRNGHGWISHEFHVGCFWALDSQWERLGDQPNGTPSTSDEPQGEAPHES